MPDFRSQECWRLSFNDGLNKWVLSGSEGELFTGKHPGELLPLIGPTAGFDKGAEWTCFLKRGRSVNPRKRNQPA